MSHFARIPWVAGFCSSQTIAKGPSRAGDVFKALTHPSSANSTPEHALGHDHTQNGEMQIPPGSAIVSSRAAIFTQSPTMSLRLDDYVSNVDSHLEGHATVLASQL